MKTCETCDYHSCEVEGDYESTLYTWKCWIEYGASETRLETHDANVKPIHCSRYFREPNVCGMSGMQNSVRNAL